MRHPKNYALDPTRLEKGQFISHGDILDKSDAIMHHVKFLHHARTQGDAAGIERSTNKLRNLGIDANKIPTPEGWNFSQPLGINVEELEKYRL
jgi:hypothetical protein